MTWLNLARGAVAYGMAPLGARRAAQLLGMGLPERLRPALDFLFERKLAPDDVRVAGRVEAMRDALAGEATSYSSNVAGGGLRTRTAQTIAYTASVPREWGIFLYLCAKGFRARSIFELGSCAGISGSYLASAPECREFTSIERSPDLAPLARKNVQEILPGARVVNAPIDDVLPEVLRSLSGGIDLYFVDANHKYGPTLRYLEAAGPFLNPGALVLFDDIHWSKQMWDVWRVLRGHAGLTHTIDVGRFGLGIWQGGAVLPGQYNLAKYTGWLWNYAPR